MKTQKELDERVPASAGMTTDNPIFRTTRKTVAMQVHDDEGDGFDLWDVDEGTEVRLYGCKLVGVASPFRYDGAVVTIPNRDVEHVEGALGEKVTDFPEYTRVGVDA